MSEKTEEPTENKLSKARREGQVALSSDINIAVTLGCGLLVMISASGFLLTHLRTLLQRALDLCLRNNPPELSGSIVVLIREAAYTIAPFCFVALFCPLLSGLLQTRFNISFKKLTPKLDSINPVNGFKRIFSLRTILDFLKTIIKAIIIFTTLYQAIYQHLPLLLGTAYLPINEISQIGWHALCLLFGIAVLTMLVFGGIDIGLQHWLYVRDQRMTKDEVKREYKESEGNPEVKQQQRQLAQEISRSSPQQRLKNAKAVVVNPTHFAVALCYSVEVGIPQVSAKGIDDDALALRAAAQALGLPILANPPLARALYTLELNDTIPEALFPTVAAILRWVDGLGALPVSTVRNEGL